MSDRTDETSIRLPESWRSKSTALLAVGAIGLLIGGAMFLWGTDQALASRYLVHSDLTNFIYCLSFGLGAIFFVMIHHLCRAGWSSSIRRVAELIASTIPWTAILFIPILLMVLSGSSMLYEWNQPKADLHGLTAEKTGYLNASFFALRSAIYIGLLIWMTRWYFRRSTTQDESGSVDLTLQMQKWSGPMIMIYALLVSFLAFDWIMSIDADWYSTIFGVYLFAGSMFGFFALMICLLMALQDSGVLTRQVNTEHFHDMGKFLFGFTMFWSYIAFSQLLLYWYGNIPEETNWYRERLSGGWAALGYLLIPVHFVLPWLGLVSRHVRRHRFGLTFWAVWALVAHWLDMTYLILPNSGPVSTVVIIAHLLVGLGMFAILISFWLRQASQVSLLAVRDPRLEEALAYTNPLL